MRRIQPPFMAKWLLSKFLHDEDSSHRIGDFEEVFQSIVEHEGKFAAWKWYWLQVVRSAPNFINLSFYWSIVMFKSYLKTALRNFRNQKIYATINILGLTIGIVGAMFILLWVQDELSYDTFHANADRIYRVVQAFNYDGNYLEQANTPGILAATIQNECPEVEMATRVRKYNDEYIVIADEKKFNEQGIGIADEVFFKFFSFPLIHGDPSAVLSDPQTVVISEKIAHKFFGGKNVIGQTLTIFEKDYRVTGVYQDMPPNSHFHIDILCSFASFERYSQPNWGLNIFKTYVLLKQGSNVAAFQTKLDDIIKNHMFNSPESYEATIKKGNYTKLPLQRLTEIHQHSNLLWEFEANGNGTYIEFFSIIALFILLIAIINYMNLATARSAGRAREVGIRKTVGSTRSSLIRQFLVESVFTALMALILAFASMQILMPSFRNMVEKPWLELPYVQHPLLLLPLILITVLVGLAAGLYPSLFLSSFKPVAVLGGKFSRGLKRSRLRNVLVVFQFSLSILLLVATLVVQKQMSFVQNKNLGFNREQVVVVKTFGEVDKKLPVLKSALLKNPSVISVSASSSIPGKSFDNIGSQLEGTDTSYGTNLYLADEDFLDLMKMEMVAGRFFSDDISTDADAIIINESLAKASGVDDILNRRIKVWIGGEGKHPFNVIGIVKDFHYESFHEQVKPLEILKLHGTCPWSEAYVSLRIKTNDIHSVMSNIQETWNEVLPGTPFEYSFLDAIYDNQYKNEQLTGRTFIIFTFLAIFVACLGLLGLTSFAVEQRTKEMGIRKVLGASVQRLALMLASDFTRWVILANLIAWPGAYYLMNLWLRNFSYRTEIGVWPFILSTILMLGVTCLTMSYHVIKTAIANPVKTLRNE